MKYVVKYTDICDDELDSIVSQIQHENPNCGQQLINGHLRARGIQIQCKKLRESVRRTDPIQRYIRWHEVLSRRTCSVKQSNSLWHIDGHHSLIRWRMVIHDGIDGYSRMVVYLACSTNNCASTVYTLFKEAIKEYGIPSRVRSDKGGENILVCHFMVAVRGILLDHRYTTKELNVFGVMCTDVYVPPIMNYSMQWKQWECLILMMKLTYLCYTVCTSPELTKVLVILQLHGTFIL